MSTLDVRFLLDRWGDLPLLTPSEERDLTQRAYAGRAAAEVLNAGTTLPAGRAAVLDTIVEQGLAARSRLIAHNIRLAVRFSGRYTGLSMENGDLAQEAVCGLADAVDRFDPSKGYRFTTYATWWIRQRCGKALHTTGRTVRIPSNLEELAGKISQVESSPHPDGHAWTVEEVADAIGVEVDKVLRVKEVTRRPVSLSAPLPTAGDGSELTVGSVIPDRDPTPEEEAAALLMAEQVKATIAQLDGRLRQVITLRFGLGPDEPLTLAQTADIVGVSRERVRQLEMDALRQLRTLIGPTAYQHD